MSSFERISAYLEAHPTPWRLVKPKAASPGWEGLRVYPEPDEDGYEGVLYRQERDVIADVVVDANGAVVVETADNAGEASWLEGDVRALVDFVNLVGEDYEPPCGWPGVDYGPIEPVDAGPYSRRLSDADMERLKENMPESFAPEGVRGLLRRLGWRGLG